MRLEIKPMETLKRKLIDLFTIKYIKPDPYHPRERTEIEISILERKLTKTDYFQVSEDTLIGYPKILKLKLLTLLKLLLFRKYKDPEFLFYLLFAGFHTEI